MHQQDISYQAGGAECLAHVCYDTSEQAKKPAVLIVHAFEGRTDSYCQQAAELAKMGYVGIAIDMYGQAETADTLEGCLALMSPVMEDRTLCRNRLTDTLNWVKSLECVNNDQIAILGYCFGGMCALDLARSGANLTAAISIHGVFSKPELPCDIKSPVLILHGYDDPQVTPAELSGFAQELNNYEIDWQLHYFGGTKHAFTDPKAAEIGPPEFGRVYHAQNTQRAWEQSLLFIDECMNNMVN